MMTVVTQQSAQSMTFRAMGCPITVMAVGCDQTRFELDAGRIVALAEQWEQRFSRFRPESALSRLNAAAGTGPQTVEPLLFDLIRRAVELSRQSGGRFNPLVLPALISAGYDRTFREVKTRAGWVAAAGAPAPAIDLIELDPVTGRVGLPEGAQIDLGGIAKGAFVDAAHALVAEHWPGGTINAGGDLRLWGVPPDGPCWRVGIEDPHHPERDLALAEIRDPARGGAIATSGRNRRRWRTDRGPAHHLIDPRTGAPARGRIETATVFAADATTADVAAKTLFLSGDDLLAGTALGVTIDRYGFGTSLEGDAPDAITIIPLVIRTTETA
jgi:thiamine biosynthesis lipoprotein